MEYIQYELKINNKTFLLETDLWDCTAIKNESDFLILEKTFIDCLQSHLLIFGMLPFKGHNFFVFLPKGGFMSVNIDYFSTRNWKPNLMLFVDIVDFDGIGM